MITIQYQPNVVLVPVNDVIYCEHEDYEVEDGMAYCTRCDKQGVLYADVVDIEPWEAGGIYTQVAVDWEAL